MAVAGRSRRSAAPARSPTCSSSTATARTPCNFFNGRPVRVRDRRFVFADEFASGNLIYAGMGANYANAGNELWVGSPRRRTCSSMNSVGVASVPATDRIRTPHRRRLHLRAIPQSRASRPHPSGRVSHQLLDVRQPLNAGKTIGFASKRRRRSEVASSAAMRTRWCGYNASNQTVTLYQSVGHSIRVAHSLVVSDPGQLPLLRSDGIIDAIGCWASGSLSRPTTSALAFAGRRGGGARTDRFPARCPGITRPWRRGSSGCSQQRRLHMGRHVVRPFARVPVGKVLRRDGRDEDSRSAGTSGSAFSLIVSDADVCCRNTCSRPTSIRPARATPLPLRV